MPRKTTPVRARGERSRWIGACVSDSRARKRVEGALRGHAEINWFDSFDALRRYGRPVAVTECHIWSSREQQMRWLVDTWRDASALRREGYDVRAVTIWALLGTFDWDRLVVEEGTHYESGVYDVRGGRARETALGAIARQLATGREPMHAVISGPRWWKAPEVSKALTKPSPRPCSSSLLAGSFLANVT